MPRYDNENLPLDLLPENQYYVTDVSSVRIPGSKDAQPADARFLYEAPVTAFRYNQPPPGMLFAHEDELGPYDTNAFPWSQGRGRFEGRFSGDSSGRTPLERPYLHDEKAMALLGLLDRRLSRNEGTPPQFGYENATTATDPYLDQKDFEDRYLGDVYRERDFRPNFSSTYGPELASDSYYYNVNSAVPADTYFRRLSVNGDKVQEPNNVQIPWEQLENRRKELLNSYYSPSTQQLYPK